MRRWLSPLLLLVALAGLWQAAASSGILADVFGLEPFLVPAPSEIASVLWTDRAILADNARVTAIEIVAGFLVALTAGVGVAVLFHLSGLLRRAGYPLVVASQTIPVVVIAPVLVVWFGYGIAPKLAIIALICFFPIAVNTLDGLRSVDPDQVRMMRSLDAGRRRIFFAVETPTALPLAFSGARIAAAVAVIGAVFGEWAGSDAGIGHLILQDNAQLETARMFASVVVLSTIALALYALLGLLERRLIRWR